MLTIVAEENGGMLEIVPIKLAGDNGVMIAMAGLKFWKAGKYVINISESFVKPKWRIDDIFIPW